MENVSDGSVGVDFGLFGIVYLDDIDEKVKKPADLEANSDGE